MYFYPILIDFYAFKTAKSQEILLASSGFIDYALESSIIDKYRKVLIYE